MHTIIKLTDEEQVTLLTAQVLLKRIGGVPSNRVATVANIAAVKIGDVLQVAKDDQPESPPF
jgi:hypothetical protein